MINTGLHNEKEILQWLKKGDEQAFTNLYNFYRHPVYEVALRFLKSSQQAEEIVQDVFMKVWLKHNEMGLIEDFRAYVFVMARNLIFDRIKRQTHETTVKNHWQSNNFFVDDTEHLVRHHQCEQTLQDAINLLPPQQKEVYQLAKVQGLSHDSIAKKMKISRLTVKTHMAKALKSIRSYLHVHLNTFFSMLLPISFTIIYFLY
ncbi:RNA polymerase sigma-70 factor [soil metagenome]